MSQKQRTEIARWHFAAAEFVLWVADGDDRTCEQVVALSALAEAHIKAAQFAINWQETLWGELRGNSNSNSV